MSNDDMKTYVELPVSTIKPTPTDCSAIGGMTPMQLQAWLVNDKPDPYTVQMFLDKTMPDHTEINFRWKRYLMGLAYIKRGLKVVRLREFSKALVGKNVKGGGINYTTAIGSTKTWQERFHPITGTAGKSMENVGICGPFIIDEDNSHGDGAGNLQALIKKHGGEWPPAPIQETTTGGKHYVFNSAPGLCNSTSKMAKYIDTRGVSRKDPDKIGGHVVAAPSVLRREVDGQDVLVPYRWLSWPAIQDAPGWALGVLNNRGLAERQIANIGTGKGNENVEDNDLERVHPIERLEAMCAVIDPSLLEYEDWLRVGMAIHSQYPGPEGLGLWDEFSARDESTIPSGKKKGQDRYEPDLCAAKWQGFDGMGGARFGTLDHIAKSQGWNGQKQNSVVWDEVNLPQTMDAVEDILKEEEVLFVRDNRLVQIVKKPPGTVGDVVDNEEGMVIVPSTYATVNELVCNSMDIINVKKDKEGRMIESIVPVPNKLCSQFVGRTGSWKQPPLVGFAEHPFIFNNRIVQAKGYDKQTAVYLTEDYGLDVPINPSDREVEEAVQLLKYPIQHYSFESDSCRGTWISNVLSIVNVHQLDGIKPGYLVNANRPGTGKTKLVQSLGRIMRGNSSIGESTYWGNNPEEMNKVVTGMLINGSPMISFNNIAMGTVIESDFLCRIITEEYYGGRVLGLQTTGEWPSYALVSFNGNGLTVSGDMTTRLVRSNIISESETPQNAEFAFDPVVWCHEHRLELLHAALTICRGHIASGEGTKHSKDNRFDAWERYVQDPLIWAFGDKFNPAIGMKALQDSDEFGNGLVRVLWNLAEAFGSNKFKAGMVYNLILENDPKLLNDVTEEEQREIREALGRDMSMLAKKDLSASVVGLVLRSVQNRAQGGLVLKCEPNKKKGNSYWVESTTTEP